MTTSTVATIRRWYLSRERSDDEVEQDLVVPGVQQVGTGAPIAWLRAQTRPPHLRPWDPAASFSHRVSCHGLPLGVTRSAGGRLNPSRTLVAYRPNLALNAPSSTYSPELNNRRE
ncbi:hypothetical protein [Amycolatopsis sp. EV170708-02-1]|uniref:hypothetical protein n=1 Tax=Amycolatopsis sp. EV170708-02-1 TaxID=2919322 RepID=UPI001F0B74E8|nr:hypothetical protein [Amycolatopsis sp. EV170708-02-1]UMP06732.1 hypothetical protein MJQ72_18820 [Amycolatopsis sp. EV170708-02-1]